MCVCTYYRYFSRRQPINLTFGRLTSDRQRIVVCSELMYTIYGHAKFKEEKINKGKKTVFFSFHITVKKRNVTSRILSGGRRRGRVVFNSTTIAPRPYLDRLTWRDGKGAAQGDCCVKLFLSTSLYHCTRPLCARVFTHPNASEMRSGAFAAKRFYNSTMLLRAGTRASVTYRGQRTRHLMSLLFHGYPRTHYAYRIVIVIILLRFTYLNIW